MVPVLKALRAEIGEDRANEIIYQALRDSLRQEYQNIASKKKGTGKEKWQEISTDLDKVIGEDVEFHYLKNDLEAIDFNVTGCRFAELFRKLGEPELGAILSCEIDDHVAEIAGPDVVFKRPKTIMGGSGHCEFRYRFSKEE